MTTIDPAVAVEEVTTLAALLGLPVWGSFVYPYQELAPIAEQHRQTWAAFVQLREQATASAEELEGHLRSHPAHFKVPTRIYAASSPLPRSPQAKLLRQQLQSEVARSLQAEDVELTHQGERR